MNNNINALVLFPDSDSTGLSMDLVNLFCSRNITLIHHIKERNLRLLLFFNAVEMASSKEKRVEDELWYPIMVAEQVCSVVDETDLFKL